MGRDIRASLRVGVPALLPAALLVNLLIQPFRAVRDAAQTDYVAYATGARLAAAGDCLYCDDRQRDAQSALLGFPVTEGFNRFVHPALDAVLIRPFASLDLRAGLALLEVALVICLVAAGVLLAGVLPETLPSRMRLATVISALASLPAAWSLALGQLDAVAVLAIAGGTVVAKRGRPALGGTILAVALVKPQLVWMVPLVLAISGRREAVVGFVLGGCAFAAGCFAVAGEGIRDWVTEIAVQERTTGFGAGLSGLVTHATSSTRIGVAVSLLVGAAGGAWTVARRRALRGDVVAAVGAGVVLSLLASPHMLQDDLLVAAVAVVALARRLPGLGLPAGIAISLAYAVDQALAPGFALAETLVLVGLLAGCLGAFDAILPARPFSLRQRDAVRA